MISERFLRHLNFLVVLCCCFSTSLFSQTLNLQAGDFDSCTLTLPLTWVLASDGQTEIERYEIWASEKSPASDFLGPPSMVESVSNNTTNYGFSAKEGREQCVQILGITSTPPDTILSNQICLDLPIILRVKEIFLLSVSASGEENAPPGLATLGWQKIPNAFMPEATIYRTDASGNTTLITDFDPNTLIYMDFEAGGDLGPVSYHLVGHDGCGNEVISNTVSTIFLEGMSNKDGTENILSWTPYRHDDLSEDFQYYVLNEVVNAPLAFQNPEASYPSDVTTHRDQIDPSIPKQQSKCYTIMVEPRLFRNDVLYINPSFSNRVCIEKEASFYIPNAFAPNGVNNEFKPLGPIENIIDYSISIFDRYGGLVFESKNISEGWNGQSNGQSLPTGEYIYLIKFQESGRDPIMKRGSVLLIR